MSPDFDARSPEVEALIATDGPSGEQSSTAPTSGGGIIVELRRQTTEVLRDLLEDERLCQLRSEGEALSDDQAVAVALDVIDKVRASAPFLIDIEV